MSTKICTKCSQELPSTDFGSSARYSDGRLPNCKACVRNYMREYRQAHPDFVKRNVDRKREYEKTDLYQLRKFQAVTQACVNRGIIPRTENYIPRPMQT